MPPWPWPWAFWLKSSFCPNRRSGSKRPGARHAVKTTAVAIKYYRCGNRAVPTVGLFLRDIRKDFHRRVPSPWFSRIFFWAFPPGGGLYTPAVLESERIRPRDFCSCLGKKSQHSIATVIFFNDGRGQKARWKFRVLKRQEYIRYKSALVPRCGLFTAIPNAGENPGQGLTSFSKLSPKAGRSTPMQGQTLFSKGAVRTRSSGHGTC